MQENFKKKCKSIYNLTLLFFIPFQLKLRKEMNLNKSISYFTFSLFSLNTFNIKRFHFQIIVNVCLVTIYNY